MSHNPQGEQRDVLTCRALWTNLERFALFRPRRVREGISKLTRRIKTACRNHLCYTACLLRTPWEEPHFRSITNKLGNHLPTDRRFLTLQSGWPGPGLGAQQGDAVGEDPGNPSETTNQANQRDPEEQPMIKEGDFGRLPVRLAPGGERSSDWLSGKASAAAE